MTETSVNLEALLEATNQALKRESGGAGADSRAGGDPGVGSERDRAYAGDDLASFLAEPDFVQSLKIWADAFTPGADRGRIRTATWLNRQIALIDELISEQLNLILHHPHFQRLESSWRGLRHIAEAAGRYQNVKIKVLDIGWREITRDIDRAPDFDQSQLFNLIYNQEFGIAGGEPFGVLLGDYQISHRPFDGHAYSDIPTLRGLAQIAAAAFAPFICNAAPQLFGLDDFEPLGMPINFDAIFQQREYIQWRGLRELEDSRFLGVCVPGILMRSPYNTRLGNYGGLIFKEDCDGPRIDKYLWGNASYAFGTLLIREFGEVGWFAHIRGVPRDYYGGGLVTGFPALSYKTDSDGTAHKIATQVVITDHNERLLSELGFLPLSHCYDTPFAAFQSCASLQRPKTFQTKSATANARISAMLQQVFCASRFAHYIKVMIRDKVGSFTSDSDCEHMLQTWFNLYATSRDDLQWEMLARYPLRSARVQVRELPGKPGTYSSVIHLKPHYIVDHLVSELKLTTELSLAGFGTAN